jgi:phosphoribosylanthranilate isomerase
MTRVKICGLTRAEDVRLAAECGAWACGFVLTRSPRASAGGGRRAREAGR